MRLTHAAASAAVVSIVQVTRFRNLAGTKSEATAECAANLKRARPSSPTKLPSKLCIGQVVIQRRGMEGGEGRAFRLKPVIRLAGGPGWATPRWAPGWRHRMLWPGPGATSRLRPLPELPPPPTLRRKARRQRGDWWLQWWPSPAAPQGPRPLQARLRTHVGAPPSRGTG